MALFVCWEFRGRGVWGSAVRAPIRALLAIPPAYLPRMALYGPICCLDWFSDGMALLVRALRGDLCMTPWSVGRSLVMLDGSDGALWSVVDCLHRASREHAGYADGASFRQSARLAPGRILHVMAFFSICTFALLVACSAHLDEFVMHWMSS